MRLSFTAGSFFVCWFIAMSIVASSGCNSTSSPEEIKVTGDVAVNLGVIDRAYRKFMKRNKKAPSSAAELRGFLPADTNATVFTSPRDGQPLVIYWGADITQSNSPQPIVIVHEQTGSGGNRLAVTNYGLTTILAKDFDSTDFGAGTPGTEHSLE